jgi:hypothetical protein
MATKLRLRAGEDARELDSVGQRHSLKAWPSSAVVDPLSSKAERRGGGRRKLESADAGEGKGWRGGPLHPEVEGHPTAAGRVKPDEELLSAALAVLQSARRCRGPPCELRQPAIGEREGRAVEPPRK